MYYWCSGLVLICVFSEQDYNDALDEDTEHKLNFPLILTCRYSIYAVGIDKNTGITV